MKAIRKNNSVNDELVGKINPLIKNNEDNHEKETNEWGNDENRVRISGCCEME